MLIIDKAYRVIIFSHISSTVQMVGSELSKKHLEFVGVSSYQALLKEIENQDDFIIIAENLNPSMSGKDLLAQIQIDLLMLPPFIFMITTHNESTVLDLSEAGARDFLFKDHHFRESIKIRVQLLILQLDRERWQRLNAEQEPTKEEFYQFIDSIDDFVIIRELHEQFVSVNKSCMSKLKYTKNELIKMKPSDLIAPQDIFDYYLEIRLLKEKKTHVYETNMISKDYQVIPVEVSSKITRYNGKDAIISIARDISDRVETKERLKKLNHDLERINQDYRSQNDRLRAINHEIEENRHNLKLALQEAENAEELKNKFLANMSHEIRTPMNAIVGFSQLLEDADSEDIPDFVRIINNNSESLLQLINDLMDIAKIESDLVSINAEKVSVHRLLLDIETIYQYDKKSKGKGHIIIKYVAGNDKECVIETDKIRLKQVMMNLMNNALKFTEEGSIEIGYELVGDDVKIYVKDSGIGVPFVMQQKIFERFRQVDFEAKPQGTGIGLSISRSLIRLLGGDIKLDSEVKNGSVFHILHPINQDKNAKVKPPHKNMVLIAEDEEDNYHLLKYILKDLNLEVIWAKNGQEAVDRCQEKPISLILMDIKMPNMDGLEATQQILKNNPGIPIIAQTAYTQDEDKERCREAGCVAFVSKPINLTILRRTIAQFV